MSTAPYEHGFVATNLVSNATCRGACEIATRFSDTVRRVSNRCVYGSLKDTRLWFRDKTHLAQHLTQHLTQYLTLHRAAHAPQHSTTPHLCVVLGTNLVHTFFFAHLVHDSGLHLADAHNLRLVRMRKLISWRQWQSAAHAFVEILDCTASERRKVQTELARFVQHMQALRIEKPAFAPPGLGANELRARFGSVATNLWLEWVCRQNTDWNLCNLQSPLVPEDFATASAEVFPQALAFRPDECATVAHETFFATLKKIAALNSVSERHGILDFACAVRCNDGFVFESNHSLATPLFERDKLSVRIFAGCAELIAGNMRTPVATEETGLRVVPEPAWIESVEFVPKIIYADTNNTQSLFEADTNAEAAHVEIALRSKRVGNVYRAAALPAHTLFAHTHHTEPLLRLRAPSAYNFTLTTPTHVRFAKTENGTDYFQVRAANEPALLWMSAPAHQRPLPFSHRNPVLLGFCASEIPETCSL